MSRIDGENIADSNARDGDSLGRQAGSLYSDEAHGRRFALRGEELVAVALDGLLLEPAAREHEDGERGDEIEIHEAVCAAHPREDGARIRGGEAE